MMEIIELPPNECKPLICFGPRFREFDLAGQKVIVDTQKLEYTWPNYTIHYLNTDLAGILNLTNALTPSGAKRDRY